MINDMSIKIEKKRMTDGLFMQASIISRWFCYSRDPTPSLVQKFNARRRKS